MPVIHIDGRAAVATLAAFSLLGFSGGVLLTYTALVGKRRKEPGRRRKETGVEVGQIPPGIDTKTAGVAGKRGRDQLSRGVQTAAAIATRGGQGDRGPHSVKHGPTTSPSFFHVNNFLRMDCSRVLLSMGLFPNVQEITESMACLHAVDKCLSVRFTQAETLCVVVGDGVAPRTAALIAMRTKWRRIVSIDPCLPGGAGGDAKFVPDGSLKAGHLLTSAELAVSQRASDRQAFLKSRLADVDRLELMALPVEDVILEVGVGCYRHVLLLLPHAHVVPERALAALQFEKDATEAGNLPTVSVIQIPCCSFVKHDTICGQLPDSTYHDRGICGKPGGMHTIRVWADVAKVAVAQQAVWVGNEKPNTDFILAAKCRGYMELRPDKKSRRTASDGRASIGMHTA